MLEFCSIIEAADAQRPGYASSLGYRAIPVYEPRQLPPVLMNIFRHAMGTPHGIAEQQLMDFTPGHRLMLASEIPEVRQGLQDFYGHDDMFNVASRTPFLTDYSSDYYLFDESDGGVYYLDHVEGSYLVSRSMKTFLQTVLECYRRGAFYADTDGWLGSNTELEDQIQSELNPDVQI